MLVSTSTCPLCRHGIDDLDDVRVVLEENMGIFGSHAFELEPKQAEILYVLVENYPKAVSKEKMLGRVYAFNEREPDEKSLSVQMSRLRTLLEDTGWRIETIWGKGWRLSHRAGRGLLMGGKGSRL